MTDDQFEYKDFTKVYPDDGTQGVTLTPNQIINNIGVQLDKDADFFLEVIQASYTGKPYAAQFIDHTSYAMSSDLVGSFSFAAAQTGLAPVDRVMPAIMFPAGSAIIMNLANLTGSDNGPVQFLFRGTKRYYKGVA